MLSKFYSNEEFGCLESKDPGSKMSPGSKLTSGWSGFVTVVFLVPDRERAAPVLVALLRLLGRKSALRS